MSVATNIYKALFVYGLQSSKDGSFRLSQRYDFTSITCSFDLGVVPVSDYGSQMLIVDIESTLARERMTRRPSLCLRVELWPTEVYWLMGHGRDDRVWVEKPTKCKVLGLFVVDGGDDEVGEEYTSCDGEVFCKEGFRYQHMCQLAQRGHREPTLARENPGSHLH